MVDTASDLTFIYTSKCTYRGTERSRIVAAVVVVVAAAAAVVAGSFHFLQVLNVFNLGDVNILWGGKY